VTHCDQGAGKDGALQEPRRSTVFTGSPADFGKFIADETEKWAKVVRAANIRADGPDVP
jgi:hypothetical protein